MKVGILTFHRTTNFGSSLQTYGLFYKIQQLGYPCEIIDYRCPAIESAENLKTVWDFRKPKSILKNILFQPTLNCKARSLRNFQSKKMNASVPYTPDTIQNAESFYEKIMVGSDIVWGRDITCDDYNYFLDFVKDSKKKYAFSSSVGNCTVHGHEERLSKLLNDFSRIAVREKEAVTWVEKISGRTADWVCDPTMLLSAEEWKKEIKPDVREKNYILVYFDSLDGKCLKDAKEYAKESNKKVIFIKYGIPTKGVTCAQPTSLQRFLGLIEGADRVYTASYHGMLFSLYFHKEFMFYTRQHASRVLSLANKLGVQNHCGDNWDGKKYPAVDYKTVDKKIEAFREYSVEVLTEMLQEQK